MTSNEPALRTINPLAVISLVVALLSLGLVYLFSRPVDYDGADAILYWDMACGLLAAISCLPAFVTGLIAITQFKKCNLLGKIFAIAGFVIGCLSFIWSIAIWHFKFS
jgi:hypothetical protein